ncbi:Odorant receptor 7a [Blattella germanica]|nr:Odorant receptor 7a [Blattella germanica]
MAEIKKNNFLEAPVFFLHLSGLLYPPNWKQNWYKKIFYDVFTLAIAVFIPLMEIVLLMHFIANLDDLFRATAVLFQILCLMSVHIIFFYFLRHKPKLLKLIDRIETEFDFYMERVGSPERREAILSERYENLKKIVNGMWLVYLFSMLFWTIFPWLLCYIHYFIKTEELSKEDTEKYFGLEMWLPENINKFPIYEMFQMFNLMTVYCNVTNMSACYLIMFVLTYHTATLFRLICSAFEDFDYFESTLRSEYEIYDTKNQSNSFKSDETERRSPARERSGHHDGYVDSFNQDSVGTNKSIDRNKFKVIDTVTDVSNISNLEDNEEIKTRLNNYLIHCVKFHQAAIRYTDDLNDLVSPMIFIFFIFTELMLCLSAFQLVLAKMDERKLKFLTSSSTLFAWPLILCHYGDDLKSSAVKESVFSIRWYTQSKSINKLLQMVMIRAQQPVTIRPGKFYVATLETFSDICHKVYAYLTLLRQMYDN